LHGAQDPDGCFLGVVAVPAVGYECVNELL
jgi:hypothetical protein